VGTILIIMIVRGRALRENYAEHKHPFWHAPIAHIVALSERASLIEQIQGLDQGSPETVLYAPVYVDRRNRFWISPQELVKRYAQTVSDYLDVQQLQKEQPDKILSLNELSSLTKDRRLILEIMSNVPEVDEHIVKIVENNQLQDRILLHSEFDVIYTSTRKRRPQWLYGIPLGERTRASLLAGIFLEPSANLTGDALVYYSPDYPRRLQIVSPRLIAELHRRHKRVFMGPIADTNPKTSLLLDAVIQAW
jgi:hypothetical protein